MKTIVQAEGLSANRLRIGKALVAVVSFLAFGLKAAMGQVMPDDPNVTIDIMEAVSRFRQAWTNDQVGRVEVCYITTNSIVRIPVSSSLLESAYDCKIIVRHFPEMTPFKPLVKVVT